MADAKGQESSEESEIESSPLNQKNPLPLKEFPQANIPSDTIMAGSSSQEGLTGGSTGGKGSTENLSNANGLPEDKEIQSSSEED